MAEENGWTKKKVLELVEQVNDIHEKVHSIDKKVAVAVAYQKEYIKRLDEHENSDSKMFKEIYSKIDNVKSKIDRNSLEIAKITGLGGIGGILGGGGAVYVLKLMGVM